MEIPVSIKCRDASNHQVSWHIGVAKNISVEGITIEGGSLPEVMIASRVEILCFPKEDVFPSYIPAPEPVKMAGRVVWQNMDQKRLGLEILSSE